MDHPDVIAALSNDPIEREVASMIANAPYTIPEYLRVLISKASGGMKFTDLLSTVLEAQPTLAKLPHFPETLENCVRNTEGLAILEYSWKMPSGQLRHKMFVYETNE